MKRLFVWLVAGFLIFPPGASFAGERLRVTFLNPGISEAKNPTGGFWTYVSAFMQAVADDLNIELSVVYSERNHKLMERQARDIVNKKDRPDYLLVVNEKMAAQQVVKDAGAAGVKVFLVLNSFIGDQKLKMGRPRELYPDWIGSLVPDNESAGYEIGKLVVEKALQAGVVSPEGRLHLLGYSGDNATPASIERVKGLKRAVVEFGGRVDLKQVSPCNWSRDIAEIKTPHFFQRYPYIGAVWCANDPIALGAMEGAAGKGKIPGKDVFFGGLNWDPPGLEKVRDGSMVTSMGGHFMTGGWALIILYDYHHGRDFIADEGVELKRKIFSAVHSGNIEAFLKKFGKRNWGETDFKRFSKILNPDSGRYDFSLDALMK